MGEVVQAQTFTSEGKQLTAVADWAGQVIRADLAAYDNALVAAFEALEAHGMDVRDWGVDVVETDKSPWGDYGPGRIFFVKDPRMPGCTFHVAVAGRQVFLDALLEAPGTRSERLARRDIGATTTPPDIAGWVLDQIATYARGP